MQQADTSLLHEVTKRFATQCREAKGSVRKSMEPFGFAWTPDEDAYGFLASIEVHPVRVIGRGPAHTELKVYGIKVDYSHHLLHTIRVKPAS